MEHEIALVVRLYEAFNARDIPAVLAHLTADVAWANGMDGGYVHGHEGLRDYWTRQWAVVDPHVEPLHFDRHDDATISVTVSQTIRDLDGNPIVDATHGLKDRSVVHVFRFRSGKVCRFDIDDKA